MKKLLLLAAVGVAAYALGKRAGIRNLAHSDAEQNAQAEFDLVPRNESDSASTLAAVAEFDERQVALAELALERSVGDGARSLATLLLEEHNANHDRTRSLGAAIGIALDGTSIPETNAGDEVALIRLKSLDAGSFEASWIAAVTDDHSRMLEQIDDVLLPLAGDERVAEHLRLVRDDVEMHLQNAIALGGTQGEVRTA